MTLKEIIERCSALGIYKQRHITDEYGELVFFSKEIDKCNEILADILGPAVKPAGVKPAEDDMELTKKYGGIHRNQTLFKKEFEDTAVIAMIWPWQDGVHTTLKLALLKK